MSIAIICTNKEPSPWLAALREQDPTLDLQVWPDEVAKQEVTFALCWKHPPGALREYPNLRCICSMGAGVDHLLADPELPANIPVVRLVDPKLSQAMFEYVSTVTLMYYRGLDVYREQQAQKRWLQQPQKEMRDLTVGVMGLGELGGDTAQRLAGLGFNVIGWSRSPKQLESVESFAGEQQLPQFLQRTNVLVCLLPLTSDTRGILNSQLFNLLPDGACLINVARGPHLVGEDLLEALDKGKLRIAYLDVFEQEPLPQQHPFWVHPKIMVTPHCSSITDPKSVAPQIIENYRRTENGAPLLHQIDIELGY